MYNCVNNNCSKCVGRYSRNWIGPQDLMVIFINLANSIFMVTTDQSNWLHAAFHYQSRNEWTVVIALFFSFTSSLVLALCFSVRYRPSTSLPSQCPFCVFSISLFGSPSVPCSYCLFFLSIAVPLSLSTSLSISLPFSPSISLCLPVV